RPRSRAAGPCPPADRGGSSAPRSGSAPRTAPPGARGCWRGPHRAAHRSRRPRADPRSEEHTSELQSPCNIVCRLLLEKKKINIIGSREGSRNRRRLKANQTGKKFRVGINSNINTHRNNLISGVARLLHLHPMQKTILP